jgi:hypothetical protein
MQQIAAVRSLKQAVRTASSSPYLAALETSANRHPVRCLRRPRG